MVKAGKCIQFTDKSTFQATVTSLGFMASNGLVGPLIWFPVGHRLTVAMSRRPALPSGCVPQGSDWGWRRLCRIKRWNSSTGKRGEKNLSLAGLVILVLDLVEVGSGRGSIYFLAPSMEVFGLVHKEWPWWSSSQEESTPQFSQLRWFSKMTEECTYPMQRIPENIPDVAYPASQNAFFDKKVFADYFTEKKMSEA